MTRSDPPLQGGFFTTKEGWLPSDRSYTSLPVESRLSNPTSQHQPHAWPQSILHALRDCARLPAKEFALVAFHENGELETYTSPTLSNYHDKIFFDAFKTTFSRIVRRSQNEGTLASNGYSQEGGMYSSFDTDPGNDLRQSSASSSESTRSFHHKNLRSEDNDRDLSGTTKRVKRRYAGRMRDNMSDDTLTPVPSRKTQPLEIGNSAQVREFYLNRFKDMQQTACKTMGKAFVKLVEPKKQTHHPYTKGDEFAPPWWPADKTDAESYIRHKEPDHLYKKERIRLLVLILQMISLPPNRQHPSVQKTGLTIRKLEEVTNEAMSTWFSDPEHPENKHKRVFLKEIFKVAKMEERFLNNEIDGTTNVPVMFGDRTSLDAEDESEDEGLAYDTPPASHNGDIEHGLAASIPTPESMPMVSPPLIHHEQVHPSHSDPMRTRQIPHRFPSHAPLHAMEGQPGFNEQPYFSRALDTYQQPPTSQESLRRTFASPDYQNGHNGLGWQQQGMVSAGLGSGAYFSHTPLPTSSGPSYQMTQTLPPPQSMMAASSGPHFDGLPSVSGRYDPNLGPVPGTQFRTGSLGHPHNMHSQGFEGYLHNNDGQFGHAGEEMKQEPHPQHSHPHHHM